MLFGLTMEKNVSLKSILILDDDQEFSALLKSLLLKSFPDVEIHEYDPIARGEPEDSFDWSLFDVLILDHYLCVHGLTGLDLFQKHQKTPGFPPTIMLTAAGNEGLAVRAFKSGIKDYIRKDDMDATVMSEAISKAYEKHHTKQDVQSELHIMNKQIRKQRVELEEQASVVTAELENIDKIKQGNQEAMAEVEQMKTEAEEQIRKQRAELREQTATVKTQLQKMAEEKHVQLQKQRVELEEQAADVKAQLQKLEEAKQGKQEGVDEVLRMNKEAEEQIQTQRAELVEQAAAVKAQLQKMEEEKHGQIIFKDKLLKVVEAYKKIKKERETLLQDKTKAEAQTQKEHSELTKEVIVFKEKLLKVVKAYKKIKKERERLLQDKTKAEAERQQHTAEMAKANNEIENTNKALTDAEAKLNISEDEKQKLGTEYKQQLDKAKVEEDVSPPKEIETGEEILDSTQLGAVMDLDELLDTDEEPHNHSDSGVKDRPDNGKS